MIFTFEIDKLRFEGTYTDGDEPYNLHLISGVVKLGISKDIEKAICFEYQELIDEAIQWEIDDFNNEL